MNEISFRILRAGSAFVVIARWFGVNWTRLRMLRLACDPEAPPAAGPYACRPKAAGFRCVFTELSVERH